MSAIRATDTTPELIVRRLVHRLGYRFRLHVPNLPGRPDIVLPLHRKIIEVRGCFWHAHDCDRFQMPSTRRRYWASKFRRNVQRDVANLRQLRRGGWRVLVVWECRISKEASLERRIRKFLAV